MKKLTISEIHKEAWNNLKGNWKKSILVSSVLTLFAITTICAVIMFVALVIHYLTAINNQELEMLAVSSKNARATSGLSSEVSNVISFGISIAISLISFSVSWTMLKLARNKDAEVNILRDMYQAANKRFVLPIILGSIISGWLIGLATVFFIVPGVILSYMWELWYFTAKDNIDKSKEDKISLGQFNAWLTDTCVLMKGNKWRLFLLDLSLVPFNILALLTCGIGYAWLIPYTAMCKAVFYKNLVDKSAELVVEQEIVEV